MIAYRTVVADEGMRLVSCVTRQFLQNELTVFDLAQALVCDGLLLLEITHQWHEWIERIAQLPGEIEHLLDDCPCVALADGIGCEAHEFAREIG